MKKLKSFIAGFTFVELSVVIVLIGLLTGIILFAKSLLEQSEVAAVAIEFNKFEELHTLYSDIQGTPISEPTITGPGVQLYSQSILDLVNTNILTDQVITDGGISCIKSGLGDNSCITLAHSPQRGLFSLLGILSGGVMLPVLKGDQAAALDAKLGGDGKRSNGVFDMAWDVNCNTACGAGTNDYDPDTKYAIAKCHRNKCLAGGAAMCAPACNANNCETCDMITLMCQTTCVANNCEACDGMGVCNATCNANNCEACDGMGVCNATCNANNCEACDGMGACVTTCPMGQVCDGMGGCVPAMDCMPACDANNCEACNMVTGMCETTCGMGQMCDGMGMCVGCGPLGEAGDACTAECGCTASFHCTSPTAGPNAPKKCLASSGICTHFNDVDFSCNATGCMADSDCNELGNCETCDTGTGSCVNQCTDMGLVCNGTGGCVSCTMDSECPVDHTCDMGTCTFNGGGGMGTCSCIYQGVASEMECSTTCAAAPFNTMSYGWDMMDQCSCDDQPMGTMCTPPPLPMWMDAGSTC